MPTLHEYQERAVSWGLNEALADTSGVYYAVDLGLGKTVITIKLIQRLGRKACVIAPIRVASTVWPEELKKWGFEGTWAVAHDDVDGKVQAVLSNPDILILPHSSVPWLFNGFGRLRKLGLVWEKRMVVYDEATMVKSQASQRYKMLKQMLVLWEGMGVALSATPRPNSAVELWPQYYLLDEGKCLEPTVGAFRSKYCERFTYPGTTLTKWVVKPERVRPLYDRVTPITFRLKDTDYLDMPPITYNNITLQLPKSARKTYNKMEADMFLEFEDGSTEAFTAAAKSMKLRQIVQGGLYYWPEGEEQLIKTRLTELIHTAKLKALVELVETSAGRSILCAIQFKFELKMILKKYPNAPVIAGGTSVSKAVSIINDWNAGKIPLLLCHPGSLSTGVNLQHGGHILLWYSLTWSLLHYEQLNGRLYRQLQKHGVTIHHLIAEDTIDSVVLKALKSKRAGQVDMLNHLRDYWESRR
jgi:hypothetical protein